MLAGVRFRQHRLSLGGALGGLLEYAGRDLPQPCLMGATGHAFRLNLDLVFSPGSPMDLNFHEVIPLWENLGAWFKRSAVRPADAGYAAGRDEVISRICTSIDQGRPAIAFDLLGMPEYGLAVGYDQGRLAGLTLDHPEQPEWMDLSSWPPVQQRPYTRAEAIVLLDLAPDFDRRRAETASLRFAVEHFWAPSSRDNWLQAGQKAYEYWTAVLASSLSLHGPDPGLGHSYNLLVLQRARRDAALYLEELTARYPEAPSLGGAAARYREVAEALSAATAVLPFPGTALGETGVRTALAAHLRRAMGAERQGIDEIERALRALR